MRIFVDICQSHQYMFSIKEINLVVIPIEHL